MVAHLIRLKLALLANGLRRSTWQVIGLILASINAIAFVGVVIITLVVVKSISDEFWGIALIFGGAIVLASWWLLPLMAFGIDATLDPQRFATFAVRRFHLILGLGLSAMIGVPGIMTALIVIAPVVLWLPNVGAAVASLVCAPIILATAIAGSRASTTALSPLMGSRRFREVTGLIALLPVVLLGPVLIQIGRSAATGADAIPGIVETTSWTPMGAIWAVPVDVSEGQWGRAFAHMAIALATLACLLWAWHAALGRALVTPSSGGGSSRTFGLGIFARVPGRPVGAVAARCLTYWVRDTRYIGNLTILPVLPIILYVIFNGSELILMFGLAPIAAFLLGWSIAADIAMDNTAFWIHVAASVRGVTDRTGRALAAAIVGLPAITVLGTGTAWFTGRWDLLPAVAGLSLGIFLTSLGISSVVSASFISAVPRPGDGPFNKPQGSAMANLVVQGLGWMVLAVLIVPEAILTFLAVKSGDVGLGFLALAVALVLGSFCLWAGIYIGARIYDRTAPDLMARLRAIG